MSVLENRKRNAVIIGVIGAFGIFLTVWATVRSGDTLAQIHRQTQPHATIKISASPGNTGLPEPLSTNRPLRLNYYYMNIGNGEARYQQFSRWYLEYGNPSLQTTIKNVWGKFSRWVSTTNSTHASGALSFGTPYWTTAEGPDTTLTNDQIKDVRDGRAAIALA